MFPGYNILLVIPWLCHTSRYYMCKEKTELFHTRNNQCLQTYCSLAHLFPIHTPGGTSRGWGIYSVTELPARMPHIFWDLMCHSDYRQYNSWLQAWGQNVPVLQLPCEVLMRSCDTEAKCPFGSTHHLHPLDVLHRKNTSVTIARNSSVHPRTCLHMRIVPKSEAELLNSLKLL